MDENSCPVHFVSTFEEAEGLVSANDEFWLMSCGCRQGANSKGQQCARSVNEVCLWFKEFEGEGAKEKISKARAQELMRYGKEKKLLARPFRNGKDPSIIEGVCLCCDDCCYFFTMGDEQSDKGKLIENTKWEVCTECALCVEACYFKSRTHSDEEGFAVDRGLCFGCGLCVEACPENCIEMVQRDE